MLRSCLRTALLLAGSSIALLACGQDGNTATTGDATTASGSTTASSGTTGGGGDVPGAALTVLDWNIHNFYDNKKDADEDTVSTFEYQEHLDQVAAILSDEAPDIAVFAEVENLRVLDDLNETMGGGYTSTLIDGNDLRLLDVGILSKVPFTKVVSHKDDTFVKKGENAPEYRYSRDCLEVHFEHNGRKMAVLAVHFRSKGQPDANPPIPDDSDKRLAEAQHTREIADALTAADPELAVLIAGDFNDLPDSDPYNWIAGSGATAYVDAADSVPAAERYTYIYKNVNELIDHQMMSPVLAPMLDASSVKIRHGQDVDDTSDHAPLIATYLLQ